jgi:hypothetical protein
MLVEPERGIIEQLFRKSFNITKFRYQKRRAGTTSINNRGDSYLLQQIYQPSPLNTLPTYQVFCDLNDSATSYLTDQSVKIYK